MLRNQLVSYEESDDTEEFEGYLMDTEKADGGLEPGI